MQARAGNKEQVLSLIQAQREELRKLGASRLALFGSFARGEQTESSDIDLLIDFQPGRKTYRNFIHIVYLLEDVLRREVELVTPQSLSPGIRKQVMEEAVYVQIVS